MQQSEGRAVQSAAGMEALSPGLAPSLTSVAFCCGFSKVDLEIQPIFVYDL